MTRWLLFLATFIAGILRSRASLQLEVAALRHQLALYSERGLRPRIRPANRLLWRWVSRCWSQWRRALYFVQPRTVLEWQKKRFRDYWRDLSRSRPAGRPKIPPELRTLIKRMWSANPTWGSPRIVQELKKLGINEQQVCWFDGNTKVGFRRRQSQAIQLAGNSTQQMFLQHMRIGAPHHADERRIAHGSGG